MAQDGQDGARTCQDGAKRDQDGPKTGQDGANGLRWSQDGPRWRRGGPRWRQEVPRWRQDAPISFKMAPRRSTWYSARSERCERSAKMTPEEEERFKFHSQDLIQNSICHWSYIEKMDKEFLNRCKLVNNLWFDYITLKTCYF